VSASPARPAGGEPTATEYPQVRFTPPQGSTELILVRHGQSVPARPGQPFPLVDGQGDPELSEEGREQAEQVARRLATESIEAIYVTPLRRTAETAAPLARLLGLAPEVEPGLREVHLGEWEGGIYRQRLAERHPLARRLFEEQRWDVIPGAEPNEDFAARVRQAVTRVAVAHAGQRVAVFTHGGTIGQILSQASGSRPFAFLGSDNGSISHIVVADGRWIVRRYNDTAHLEHGFTLGPSPLT